jgi:hypothetical protein
MGDHALSTVILYTYQRYEECIPFETLMTIIQSLRRDVPEKLDLNFEINC